MQLEDFIKNKMKELKPTKGWFRELIETIVFVIVAVSIIRFFIGEPRWIPSGSMKPTLIEGDRIFVERFSRFYSSPQRGDIMVFYPPMTTLSHSPLKIFERLTGFFCSDVAYIKRVIGLPGDRIFVKADSQGKYAVYINGKKLKEKYVMDEYDYIPCDSKMICGPVTVPKDSYFMMGDNRGNSQDSRFWGFLPRNRFIGKATFLFWPITRIKTFSK